MILNQFGRIKIDEPQQVEELIGIHLLSQEDVHNAPNILFKKLLKNFFPEALNESAKQHKLAMLLASENQDVLSYLDSLNEKDVIQQSIFYNIALQLLHFEVGRDFTINEPFDFMEQVKLPFLSDSELNSEQLLKAIYLLLNTRTENGQIYLDDLANRGFFAQQSNFNQTKHVFFNGKSQPVFDPHDIKREVVYVESDLDTDHDGKRDLLQTTIVRPNGTRENLLKIPALYTADPYYLGTNDITTELHDVNVDLKEKQISDNSYDQIKFRSTEQKELPKSPTAPISDLAAESNDISQVYTLNEYFLARGFANVYAGGIGTRGSDGFRTCGSPEETESTIAIIQWLTGERRAFTDRAGRAEIKATWCNGNVAMTGKSYLGTLATAAATTGVNGLKTIISEAAISSWYDYYRDHGLVVAPVDCQGEDCDVLAEDCFSRQKDAADFAQVKSGFETKMQELRVGQDRESGNYNTFWDARNYRNNAKNIKCDVLYVHGLNDWNVKPKNVGKMWNALRENQAIHKKVILHQGPHIYINNIRSLDFNDMMNLWLSYECLDVKNNAPEVLPNVLIQDNSRVETWNAKHDWDQPTQRRTLFHVMGDKLTIEEPTHAEIQTFVDDGTAKFLSGDQDVQQWEKQLILNDPSYENTRLLFKTTQFESSHFINGTPNVTVQVASDHNKGFISVMLLDLGEFKRLQLLPSVIEPRGIHLSYEWLQEDLKEFKFSRDPSAYQLISKGHINLQNQHSSYQTEAVNSHEFYTLNFDLQPTFYRLETGHQLGLMIYSTDMGMTIRSSEVIDYAVDLNATQLDLPMK